MRITTTEFGDVDTDYEFDKFIQAPEFYRLRHISQLGNAYHLYPGANHSRYYHSIITHIIATRFLWHLREHYPSQVTKRQIYLVGLAALYHDIGHVAYSHTLDHHHAHEAFGAQVLENVVKRLDKSITDGEIIMMKHMILPREDTPKHWMYQLISGTVDVDRIAYVITDSYMTGKLKHMFTNNDLQILISDTFIGDDDQLWFHSHCEKQIVSLLTVRFYLFKEIYMHRDIICINEMMRNMKLQVPSTMEDKLKFVDAKMDELMSSEPTFHRIMKSDLATCQILYSKQVPDDTDGASVYEMGTSRKELEQLRIHPEPVRLIVPHMYILFSMLDNDTDETTILFDK